MMEPPQNGICLASSHHHGDIATEEISYMYPAAGGEAPEEACFLSFFDPHGLQEPQCQVVSIIQVFKVKQPTSKLDKT